MDLVYKNEKTLFALMLVLSLLAWAALVAGAGWAVLAYGVAFFLFYCFAQSALISYIKGTGVLVFEPSMDEHKRIAWACRAEGILPQGCH
jgi:hypothetical protein